MAEKGDPVAKMSKAAILKEFGPKIVKQFGNDELKFIKEMSSGPGGIDTLRSYVRDYFYNRGGMVKKKKPMKASKGGTPMAMGKAKMAKKKMRGGGMTKMRGGGMPKKKMMGGGMAKMAKKKKMMRGGMAKKKK